MSNTSDNHGGRDSPPPPRPAVFDSKPVQSVQTKHRVGAARSLRKAVITAAENCGGEGGLVAYLEHMASSEHPSDRTAYMSMLSKILPRAVAVQAEVNTGVSVVLPWLQEQRGVDATPAGGVVIDQPTENIDETKDV